MDIVEKCDLDHQRTVSRYSSAQPGTAMVSAPHSATAHSACRTNRSPAATVFPFKNFLHFVLLLGALFLAGAGLIDHLDAPAAYSVIEKLEPVQPVPKPPSKWNYRGYTVTRDTSGVHVASLGITAGNGREIHFEINSRLFRDKTGIHNSNLESIYAAADKDYNGNLSWKEVVVFQQETYRRFTYRLNATALRPDEFLSQNGGDCEDFALYTCGMLSYWGWNCKVACFNPPRGGIGHAIAFVWSANPIPGYGSVQIGSGHYAGGKEIRPGYWIPIDYDQVGAYSNAMGNDWYLWDLCEPTSLYGQIL